MPGQKAVLGKYYPLTRGGDLIEAPADRVVDEALRFLNENRLPQRKRHLSRFERVADAGHRLEDALGFLVPLASNMATRYLVCATTNSHWVLLWHNHAKVRGDLALISWLTETLRVRAVGWSCQEHTVKQESGEKSRGYPGGANFYTHANGKLVRAIDCVYEGDIWRFAQYGTPYEFEQVARYTVRRRKDRLICTMVREYLAAFDLFPAEERFYRVDAAHPAQGIRFVSDDPDMNAWIAPVTLEQMRE